MDQQKTTILPPQIIAALYENVLIDELHGEATAESKITIIKKNTVVIASGEPLPTDQKIFLEAILKACRLDLSGVEILTEKNPLASDYKKMKDQLMPENVILFGLPPSAMSLPVHFPPFQIQAFQGTKYLHAPALDAIEKDKSLKTQLWQCLKQLFP